MTNFYVLDCEDGLFGTKWAYSEFLKPRNIADTPPSCPVCGGLVGLLPQLPPYRVKLSSSKPKKWGDFVWGGSWPPLISERFKSIYLDAGLRGLEDFTPVEISSLGTKGAVDLGREPPTYFLVRIKWNGGNLDDGASGIVRRRATCGYCRGGVTERYEGIVIQEGSWSGEDIFEARGMSGRIIVSERFRQVAIANAFTNVTLLPAEKCAYDEARTRYAPARYQKE